MNTPIRASGLACVVHLLQHLPEEDYAHKENYAGFEAPSTRIRRFLYPQIFLCGYT